MKDKVVVIGTNHAGTNCLLYLVDNYSDKVDLTTYDQNDNISFLGCGIALWISGVISKPDGLFYANPKMLSEKDIDVNMNTKVTGIDFSLKKIKLRNLKTNEEFEDDYDKLVISVGSWPVLPNVRGINLNNVVFVKTYHNARNIIDIIKNKDVKRIAVVGAGYIGVELAEAFYIQGKETVLINDQDILNYYYDNEFRSLLKDNIKDKVKLCLWERLEEIIGDENDNVKSVITDKGNKFDVDMVLISIGHRANTDVFKDTDLQLTSSGLIKVNNKQETNIKDVYAIGDCTDIQENYSKQRTSIMLATNAVRCGIVAALNIAGINVQLNGVQGSNAIHVFGLTMCSTGTTEELAKQQGIDCDSILVEENIRPDFMPTNNKVMLKVVWNKKDKRIIGAQIASKEDITLALHMFSLAIEQGYKIDQLALLDLFFLPHFNQPINFITKAGLLALKKITKNNNE